MNHRDKQAVKDSLAAWLYEHLPKNIVMGVNLDTERAPAHVEGTAIRVRASTWLGVDPDMLLELRIVEVKR